MNRPLKIAIVVQGRFFAFDLARELIRQGHEVTLLTNYPARICTRWGVPQAAVRSFLLHGVFSRVAEKLGLEERLEPLLHRWFGRWAQRCLHGSAQDAVVVFSGVAEEVFMDRHASPALRVLVRASSHVRTQRQILLEEEMRAQAKVAKPSLWRVAREEREYLLADRVWILGGFSRRSFLAHQVLERRLWIIGLAAELRLFHARPEVMQARRQRVLGGEKLRLLTTGTFSYRKGCIDLVEIARQVSGWAEVTFVGTVTAEARALAQQAAHAGLVRFLPRVPEKDLPRVYAEADVFLMPTLEDGFAVVVAHAKASGLPVLVTENCDAADIIQHGVCGWVLPPRTPGAFVAKLRAWHDNRAAFMEMAEAAWQTSESRGWQTVAAEMVAVTWQAKQEQADQKRLKIAIGVQGRFHAFGLAQGLLELGHQVQVLTNYPSWIVERFGLPRGIVRGHWLHGLAVRLVDRLGGQDAHPDLVVALHAWFGRWLAANLSREDWDVTYTWSSVSLEHLRAARHAGARLLARGSTHICWQDRQIEAEVERSDMPLEHPLSGIIVREVQEYALADAVVVLSGFCQSTFMKEGHPEKAVRVMVPGVDNHEFLASPAALAARRQRHLTGKPLRVLMTGAFSYRKGALDFTEAVRRLHGQGVEFRVVGQPSRAAYRLREELAQQIEFISRVPQDELLAHYEWADLFVFPSLEEGLAAVLWQAAAAGLPVVATQESGFEELLRRGVPGWLVPARDAGALVERIAWARDHREQLLAFMDAAHASGAIRPWRQAAEDFAGICAEVCARKKH